MAESSAFLQQGGATGAIRAGDLVIVDGHPETHIGDLRRTEFVVRAGRVYRTRELYAAAGLTVHW